MEQTPQIFEVHHTKGIDLILKKYEAIDSGDVYAYSFLCNAYVEGISCASCKILAKNTIVSTSLHDRFIGGRISHLYIYENGHNEFKRERSCWISTYVGFKCIKLRMRVQYTLMFLLFYHALIL